MTLDERLERLTGVVETLAATVASHDDQIESLIAVAEKQQAKTGELEAALSQLASTVSDLTRQWQAYLNTIHPRQ
jgi:hypothetical protein